MSWLSQEIQQSKENLFVPTGGQEIDDTWDKVIASPKYQQNKILKYNWKKKFHNLEQ